MTKRPADRVPHRQQRQPKAGDDEYSLFELVMQHENKKKFLDVLDHIRTNEDFATLEESIMHLVGLYENRTGNRRK